MSYDPREEWVLHIIEDLNNHGVNKYRFRSIESKNIDGYNMRKCVDIYSKIEEAAWNKLEKIDWSDKIFL